VTSKTESIPEIYAWVRELFGGRFPSMDELATEFYKRAHETPAAPTSKDDLADAIRYYEEHVAALNGNIVFFNHATVLATLVFLRELQERRGVETPADGDAITSLCDRLDRIHKIAIDRVTNDSARLVMIANESEGFMPIPPCSLCKQRHAEPEQDCPQLGAQKTPAECAPGECRFTEASETACIYCGKEYECPHGSPLAENTCGPCSEGRPNRPPRGKPCTCDNCLGSSVSCRVEAGQRLGELWYCRKAAESKAIE
jgi:hypothetical protein